MSTTLQPTRAAHRAMTSQAVPATTQTTPVSVCPKAGFGMLATAADAQRRRRRNSAATH